MFCGPRVWGVKARFSFVEGLNFNASVSNIFIQLMFEIYVESFEADCDFLKLLFRFSNVTNKNAKSSCLGVLKLNFSLA